MKDNKRTLGKWVALIIVWLSAGIGGIGALMVVYNFAPYITVESAMFINQLIPTLIWLTAGVLLIQYGLRKSEKNHRQD